MNFILFSALLIGAAAGLASAAARLLLKGRARNIASTVLVAGIVAAGVTTDFTRSVHFHVFGQEELVADIKLVILERNLSWMFDDEADIERFAKQVVFQSGQDRDRLKDNIARMARDAAAAQMRYLRESDIKYLTDLLNGAVQIMRSFIDTAQFENCRTFLRGGYSFPGSDPAVSEVVVSLLREAVQSGKRGEKNWAEVGADELNAYNLKSIDFLRGAGYTEDQIQGLARLQTTEPEEMESNCRISHDMLVYRMTEFPPEVAVTSFVSAY